MQKGLKMHTNKRFKSNKEISFNHVSVKQETSKRKNDYYNTLVNAIEETLEFISSCESVIEKMRMENHLEDLRLRLTEFKKGNAI